MNQTLTAVREPSSLVSAACGAAALTVVGLKRRRECRRAKRTRHAGTRLRFQAVPTTSAAFVAGWQTQPVGGRVPAGQSSGSPDAGPCSAPSTE